MTPLPPGDAGAAYAVSLAEIARLARAEAVEELFARLPESSWAVRRAVVEALANIPSAVDRLCTALVGERDDETRLASVVEALVTSRGAADHAVMSLLQDDQAPAVLCDVAHILGRRLCTHAGAELARLTTHPDDNVAAAAIEALGRIGGGGAVALLVAAVESRNFFRTFPAISPLGRSADPRAVAPLVALLVEPRYAAAAAEALGDSGCEEALPPLVALLVHVDDGLVRTAAGALERLRARHEVRFDEAFVRSVAAVGFAAAARARLRGSFAGGRAAERVSTSVVLGWLHDDTSVTELLALLGAEPADVDGPRPARDALIALGSRAEPRLLEALRDGDSAQRLRLMPIIAPTRAGIPVFVACLRDDEPRVRAYACRALSRVEDPTIVPALFELIGDANAMVSQAAVTALQSLESPEMKSLTLEAARSNDLPRFRAALRLIAHFAFREGLDVMVAALSDPRDRIRDAAIGGLPLLDDPRALAALLETSASRTPGARAAAMRALGHSSARAVATGALRRGIHDEDAWVRYYACQALGKLEVFEALSEVIALVDDPAGQVRVAAIEAIARLGDGQATTVLDGACRSADLDIRRAAILGLGAGDRASALPILLREATSEDSATRLYALSALAARESDESTEALVRATSDPVLLVQRAALAALATRPGPRSTLWLVTQLHDPLRKGDALAALAQPVDGRIQAIMTALETADSSLAPLLVCAFTAMDSEDGQAAIEATLALENVHARRSGARALTALDTSGARALVDRTKLTDPDEEVRRICAAVAR